jgi:hypothetical protein
MLESVNKSSTSGRPRLRHQRRHLELLLDNVGVVILERKIMPGIFSDIMCVD